MRFRFPIVIIDEDFRSENTSGLSIRALAKAIEDEGMEVLGTTSYGDLASFAQQQSRAGAFILSIDDEEFHGSPEEAARPVEQLRTFVQEIRFRNADIPIFLYGETRTSRHIPNDVLRELHGFIHMFEDTPEFVARLIIRESKQYLESLPPPFFRALTHYAQDGSYSWHCPGHSGGVAFLKSPVGQMFHQFFGENMLRADVCNSVDELGQLLDHTGPVAASERNAARIFNADHLYFVTNGTSTSNKIVWHSTVAPGDIVVVDRNCHKSVLHSIIMTGAVPVFLMPTRNNFGIIGPIPKSEFAWENIQKKIAANPFATDKNAKPRVLTITQSTYDGIIYNVEEIKKELDGRIDTLHFDEAWLPHAAFHDFYGDYHAIGADRPRCKESMVFATQSTHKTLTSLRQGSMIHVNDQDFKGEVEQSFREAYMTHTSTSPNYQIIASLDVGRRQVELEGFEFVQRQIESAMAIRRAVAMHPLLQKYFRVLTAGDMIPEQFRESGVESYFHPEQGWKDIWHSWGQDEFVLDPTRITLAVGGTGWDGDTFKTRILMDKYGIQINKTSRNTVLFMTNIGTTRSSVAYLIEVLVEIAKELDELLDDASRMERMAFDRRVASLVEHVPPLPDFSRFHAAFRSGSATSEGDIRGAFFLAYDQDNCDYQELDAALEERVKAGEELVSASFIIPYPPGFPILVPGQVISHEIIAFMRALDVSEIHGYRHDLGLRVFNKAALEQADRT